MQVIFMLTCRPPRTALVLALLAGGCGDGSTTTVAPTPDPSAVINLSPPSRPLAVPVGEAWLQIWGLQISTRPEPVCAPALPPPEETSITTAVHVQAIEPPDRGPGSDGRPATWVATSSPGAGSIQLRFLQTGAATLRGEPLVGSIRGVGRDTTVGAYRPASSVNVTLAGFSEPDASVDGIGSPVVPFLYGTLTGRFAFSDPTGATSTCRLLYWTLQPRASPPPSVQWVPSDGRAAHNRYR